MLKPKAWGISPLDSSSREREPAQPSTDTSVLPPALVLKNLPLLSETKTQQDFLVCRPRFCFVFGGQGHRGSTQLCRSTENTTQVYIPFLVPERWKWWSGPLDWHRLAPVSVSTMELHRSGRMTEDMA
ncbi:uncharacterized protein LOC104649882 isoform X1 [Saimiri boliviensis]|uniref:uncharacterized protein LOC104649882 isoform X1 n=1 Tax=Saimiri boliviensis TaxID=27679 RepID=UPI003D77BD55